MAKTVRSETSSDVKVNLKLTLRNDNVINGTSALSVIGLNTKYGNLNIPVQDVNQIELGIIENDSDRSNIENLIALLSETNNKDLKNIYYKIISLGINAIPAIQKIIDSSNYVASIDEEFNAENALAELKQKFSVNDNYTDADVVLLHGDYKVPGVYNFETIELSTEFGTLTIPKSNIVQIEINFQNGASSTKSFKVNAATHISGNATSGWLKTGINLKVGQKFTVSAKGEVVLASLSNSKYKPDGSTAAMGTTSFIGGNDNDQNAYPIYGNLVYKIGEAGSVLKFGSKYSGTAGVGGMLFLSIYETVYNAANSGSYTVTINCK